jgi:hypothetical protein
MNDTNERSVASLGSRREDIIDRLRKWKDERGFPTPGELMDEASCEIERLRLTSAERTIIQWAAAAMRPDCRATLRGLLERTK